MKKGLFVTLSALFAFVAITGCSEAPTDQVEEAQFALTAADEAEADLYAADQFIAAQDSFAAAQAEIEVQNARSAFARNYGHAEALLQSATATANASLTDIEQKKEAVRVEADSLIAQAQSAIAGAQQLLASPRGKQGQVALVAVQENAGSAQTTLNEAITAQQNGEFAKALELAKIALEKAQAINAELTTVATTPQS